MYYDSTSKKLHQNISEIDKIIINTKTSKQLKLTCSKN